MVVNDNLNVDPTDRIENESAVVPRMIMRSRARSTIIGGTCLQGGFMELLDLLDSYVADVTISHASCTSRSPRKPIPRMNGARSRLGLTVGSECSMLSLENLFCGCLVHLAATDPEIGSGVTHSYGRWDGAHPKDLDHKVREDSVYFDS
jgi:hypothetical protein